jgi:S-sulfosulfanyl-L-cysteine sulfohydrolase
MASCNRMGEPLSNLCRMRNAVDAEIQDYTLHDAVEAYLTEKGTISPIPDGRALAIDLGPEAFSQMNKGKYQFQ